MSKEDSDVKNHYVAWVCDPDDLHGCALQGPHTYKKACEIRDGMHKTGIQASTIYSPSLERLAKYEASDDTTSLR